MQERGLTLIRVGQIVLVEQAWEDETGAYHDEWATVCSVDPVRLHFFDVYLSREVSEFLSTQEFTLNQLTVISS